MRVAAAVWKDTQGQGGGLKTLFAETPTYSESRDSGPTESSQQPVSSPASRHPSDTKKVEK